MSVFKTIYSGTPVFETVTKDVAVMRRATDNYVNATQVLRAAGLPKTQRTKILEKYVASGGSHEKVQGGYHMFQGTWVNLESAIRLAKRQGIYEGTNIQLLCEYQETSEDSDLFKELLASKKASKTARPAPVSKPSSAVSSAKSSPSFVDSNASAATGFTSARLQQKPKPKFNFSSSSSSSSSSEDESVAPKHKTRKIHASSKPGTSSVASSRDNSPRPRGRPPLASSSSTTSSSNAPFGEVKRGPGRPKGSSTSRPPRSYSGSPVLSDYDPTSATLFNSSRNNSFNVGNNRSASDPSYFIKGSNYCLFFFVYTLLQVLFSMSKFAKYIFNSNLLFMNFFV